jgi:hypothetical protein
MKFRINFLLGLILVLIASSTHAHAAPRTWVSGVGDDSNPCSRTAPCKTFDHVISMTDPGGEIVVLDPGDYGPVKITQSVTIDGHAVFAGITGNTSLVFPGTDAAVVVDAGPTGVVILRGLNLSSVDIGDGTGTGRNGIQYKSGATLVIDHCSVSGFTQNAIDVSLAGPKNLVVNNTNFASNTVGIHLADTTGTDARAQVTNCVIAGNTAFGVRAEGKGTISVANSLLTQNGVAVRAETDATVRLSNNEIFDNGIGIGCVGASTVTSGTVASADNNKRAPNGPCRPNARITVQ